MIVGDGLHPVEGYCCREVDETRRNFTCVTMKWKPSLVVDSILFEDESWDLAE